MSDDRLIQQLRAVVTRDEPAFTLTSNDIRRLRGRARARTAVVMSALSVLLLAIGLVAAHAWRTGPDTDPARPQEYSPERLHDAIVAAADRVNAGGPKFAEPRVTAYDAQNTLLVGGDRVYASTWRGSFSWSADHVLEVYAAHNASEAEGDPQRTCEAGLSAGSAIACEITRTSHGIVVETTVRAAKRARDGWPVLEPAEYDRMRGRLHFLHQVKAWRGGDLIVSAREIVKAPSLEAAEAGWLLSDADLQSIATDPALAFPTPPSREGTCQQLTADVPDDLDLRREAEPQGSDQPTSIGVIWSNDDASRMVHVSSSATGETVEDARPIDGSNRPVQGVSGWEYDAGAAHVVIWRPRQATGLCRVWRIVSEGLSQTELDDVLQSVREVGTPDVPPDEEAMARVVAEGFLSFAVGAQRSAHWADEVTVLLAGTEVRTVDPNDADRDESWQVCPAGVTEYEGRRCPVSPIVTLLQAVRQGQNVAREAGPPQETVGCNAVRPPSGLDAASAISLRPAEAHRNCFTDFAVTLYLNEVGRIAAVDFVLSGP